MTQSEGASDEAPTGPVASAAMRPLRERPFRDLWVLPSPVATPAGAQTSRNLRSDRNAETAAMPPPTSTSSGTIARTSWTPMNGMNCN